MFKMETTLGMTDSCCASGLSHPRPQVSPSTNDGKVNSTSSQMQADGVDLEAIQEAVRTILRAVGEDTDRPGLQETPRRVAKMYEEMFAGLQLDPARHLHVTFPEGYDEIVLVRDIAFNSMCEHHLLPFSGVAHVAYIPNGRVTGLQQVSPSCRRGGAAAPSPGTDDSDDCRSAGT